MKCDAFERYERGELDAKTFQGHAKHCPRCREEATLDRYVMEQTSQLRTEIHAPELWPRIEIQLRRRAQFRLRALPKLLHNPAYRWAAGILLALTVGMGLFRVINPPKPRLLSDTALRRVERAGQEYEKAIAELERYALPKLLDANTDLMLLYRDKIETIDEQISECKAAAVRNPANAHIRRFLLAAYRDKRSTLEELLKLPPSQPERGGVLKQ
jgi:antitoxin component HigA of HigAB toxin-antitoxin module